MSKPTAADVGRACQNCGATKTPVWRTGPSGPKTMCNRCGIKWMRKNPIADRAHTPTSPRKRSNSPLLGDSEPSSANSSPEMSSRNRSYRKKKVDDDYELLVVDDEEELIQEFLPEVKSPIKKRKSQQYDETHTPLSIESNNSSSSCVPMELVSSMPDGSDDSSPQEDCQMNFNSDDDTPSYRGGRGSISPVHMSIPFFVPALSLSSAFRPVVPGPVSPYTTPRHDAESGCPSPAFNTNALEPISSQAVDVHRCAQQIEARISNVCSSSQQYLDFSLRSNITGNLLRTLPCNLQSLNLSRCKPLLDSDLLFLPAQLQVLNLSYCVQLTDECLKHMPHSLQNLNISHCYFSDEGIKALPMTLTSLDVSMCYQITDEGASALPPLLLRLNMDGCKITNEALKCLPSPLQFLSLQSCDSITDDGLIALPINLTQLNLGCTRIFTCDGLQYLTNLRHLDLTQCEVSDECFGFLPSSLEWLNMYRCSRITHSIVERLPPNLEFLNLKSTSINSLASELKLVSPNLKLHI